jgi:DNA-binding response OmpR family regulator
VKRILVIDDDEDLLEILSLIFQAEGYNVVLSNNSEVAEHVREIGPDLVILDIRISGSVKNGGEICQELKNKFENARIPVLLISAEANIRRIAEACGADGYIKKPFDIDDLLLRIKELLH